MFLMFTIFTKYIKYVKLRVWVHPLVTNLYRLLTQTHKIAT